MLDFTKIRTVPLHERKNKFSIDDMIPLDNEVRFVNSDLKKIAQKIKEARKGKKQIIMMIGGHVVKTGCSDLLIDLAQRGYITTLGMNGAAAIHDCEIAMIGKTSESVEDNIENGTFGMAEETGSFINSAAKSGAKHNKGYGDSLGRMIEKEKFPYKDRSLLYTLYKNRIPATVHTAIGTEIIYQHPSCSGAALGKVSYEDFKLFTDSVSKLEGGVIINIGSAVIMPEVFLKALAIARNLGCNVTTFTSANFDMIKHYRPSENLVKRPTSLGGKGYQIIERHEKTIPSLYNLLKED
jgi:deoxyhypusine synthase